MSDVQQSSVVCPLIRFAFGARRGKTITDPDTYYELYGEHSGEPWRGIHIALLLERRQGGVFKGLLIRHNGELVFSMSNDFKINQHIPGDWERDLERLAIKGDPDTNTPPARLQ